MENWNKKRAPRQQKNKLKITYPGGEFPKQYPRSWYLNKQSHNSNWATYYWSPKRQCQILKCWFLELCVHVRQLYELNCSRALDRRWTTKLSAYHQEMKPRLNIDFEPILEHLGRPFQESFQILGLIFQCLHATRPGFDPHWVWARYSNYFDPGSKGVYLEKI